MSPQRSIHLTRRTMLGAAAAAASAQTTEQAIRLPEQVRLGLLGLDGHTGEVLGPLPRLPDVKFVAVSDPNADRVNGFVGKPRYAGVRPYTDYRRMLDNEKLDMVGVCTPNGDRAEAILACVSRNLHVVAEKPLALKVDDLKRIEKAVSEAGIRLTTMLPMRFSSPYLALKEIVDSGAIGQVAQIAAQKSYKAGSRPAWMRNRATYGGTIPWIGIHMIDLMRHTSGREFTEVFSLTSHIDFPQLGDMENVTTSVFGLDNGGIATLRMDYLRPSTASSHGDDRLRLAGTKGVIEYQASSGVTVITESSPPRRVEKLPPRRYLFVNFLESLYKGVPNELTLEDIYRVNHVTLAAQQAAEEHKIIPV